jgi:hypothetical protein
MWKKSWQSITRQNPEQIVADRASRLGAERSQHHLPDPAQHCPAAGSAAKDKFVDLTCALLYFWKADGQDKDRQKNLNA